MSKDPTTRPGIPASKQPPEVSGQDNPENQAAQICPPSGVTSSPEARLTREQKAAINREEAARVQAQELAAVKAAAHQLAQAQPVLLARSHPYTDDIGDMLCAWIAKGHSLRSWCQQQDIPQEVVYRWIRQRADLRERYAQAHEDRADSLADELLEIADQAAQFPSIEGVAAAKLRVETRKWIASKLKPTKYGDKQEVQHTGGVHIAIGIPQKPAVQAVERVDAQAIEHATPRQH